MEALSTVQHTAVEGADRSRNVEGPSFSVNFETGFDTVTKILLDAQDKTKLRISFTQEMVP